MDSSDILFTVVMAVFVLIGMANLIAIPFITRKFFRENQFSDTGKSQFNEPAGSEILQTLATRHLHTTQYHGYTIKKAKCHLEKRSFLIFSKIKRKQVQSRWSITILDSEQALPVFSLLAKTDPKTVMIMLNEPGVDLDDDEEIGKRYLLLTDDSAQVLPLINDTIREFLMDSQLASIESLGHSLVIKRSWPIERIYDNLKAELDCAVAIAEHYN